MEISWPDWFKEDDQEMLLEHFRQLLKGAKLQNMLGDHYLEGIVDGCMMTLRLKKEWRKLDPKEFEMLAAELQVHLYGLAQMLNGEEGE